MVKLNEVEDDTHLNVHEQIEERIGSVDYDVWCCTSCDAVEKIRYAAFFTKYAKCPQCRARTKSSSTATIRHATTTMTGLSEVTERCAHCDYVNVSQQIIPMVEETQIHAAATSLHSTNDFGSSGTSGHGASGSW